MKVKSGHTIYVTVNSPSSPTFSIPDIIDNSSVREAEAKLTAMGFHLLPHQFMHGEKDWVYGILCKGHRVATGDRVSIDSPLTLIVGDGLYGDEMDVDYTEAPDYVPDGDEEVDEFEEVPERQPQQKGEAPQPVDESGLSDF